MRSRTVSTNIGASNPPIAATAAVNVIGLLGPPPPDSEDGLEEGHQVRQIHLRDLSGYRSEFEERDMTDKTADRVDCVLAAESRASMQSIW